MKTLTKGGRSIIEPYMNTDTRTVCEWGMDMGTPIKNKGHQTGAKKKIKQQHDSCIRDS